MCRDDFHVVGNKTSKGLELASNGGTLHSVKPRRAETCRMLAHLKLKNEEHHRRHSFPHASHLSETRRGPLRVSVVTSATMEFDGVNALIWHFTILTPTILKGWWFIA